MDLIQIIQAVTGELGLVQPTSAIGATDLQTIQLTTLVNREGDNLKRMHNWTALQQLFTLNVGAPLVTTGTVAGGSAVITAIPTTAAITAETFVVTGSNIPVAARVLTVDSGTQITMDMVATGSATTTGVALTFSKDTYPEPTAFDRFINGTAWDRTNRWQLLGPDSPQIDEYHRSGIVTTGPRRHFRQVGSLAAGTYRLWPPPQTIDSPFQIAWEYISLAWCKSNAGVLQTSMTADTDVPILDPQAIILGTKWRFLEAKGIPTAASMQQEYLDYVQQLISRDGGAPTLNMGRRFQPYLIGSWQVPDGNWPGGQLMRATLKTRNSFMEGTGEAKPQSIPASVKGWDQISSLANMDPDHAVQLDNWIPRPGYLEIRRGSDKFATGIGSGVVNTIMAYNSPNLTNSKLFAVGSNGTIYDITAGGVASATSITGLTNSALQYCIFTNAAANSFLVAANGADTPVIYDGSTWANMTLTGITPADAASWTSWKGRLWCTLTNSTKVGYLASSAISGAVTTFDLGQQMTRGGFIVAIATWTQDSKQTVDEYLAFISSRGQVMVYQGTDPSTANTFALVGVYDLGAPIGKRCYMRIAGNLWVISVDGITPMSEMMTLDRGAVAKVAPTTMIQNAMMNSSRLYKGNFGWQLIEYAKGQLVILNIPLVSGTTSAQYVMNTLTGAWCQFTGLDAQCWEILNDVPYFGSVDGRVYQWDIGSGDFVGDENLPITATVQTAFNYFGTRGHLKQWTMVRPILTTDGSVTPGVGLNIDFGQGAPVSIPSTVNNPGAQWDVALWDQAIWPAGSSTVANWTTVEGIGQCASIITTVSTSDNGLANGVVLQLNGWDLISKPGKGVLLMKYLVCGNDALIQQWAADTFGIICTKVDLAVAIIENKTIVAAAFFQAHNGPDVELSYYGPNTMTLDVVKGLAKIAVDHLGVSRVTARTAKSNKKAAEGFRKIGFVYEGIRHHGYGEQDAVMYGLFGARLAKLAGKEMQ